MRKIKDLVLQIALKKGAFSALTELTELRNKTQQTKAAVCDVICRWQYGCWYISGLTFSCAFKRFTTSWSTVDWFGGVLGDVKLATDRASFAGNVLLRMASV